MKTLTNTESMQGGVAIALHPLVAALREAGVDFLALGGYRRQIHLIRNAEGFRGRRLDWVAWGRQPDDEERMVALPCLPSAIHRFLEIPYPDDPDTRNPPSC